MLTKKEFWSFCIPRIQERALTWGFEQDQPFSFMRRLNDIWHGFAIVMNRHGPDAFYVEVGVHIPCLYDKAVFVDQADFRGFEVSHRLGHIRDHGESGTDVWFRFSNRGELLYELNRMFQYFESWAFPWYEQFKTLEDVAHAFYDRRIDDDPSKFAPDAPPRLPDPMAWAFYGWMLEQLNRLNEAVAWWRRAYDEVRRPLFMMGGRFVAKGTKGARQVRHPEAEERLEELLRQSLQIDLNG